MTIATAMTQTRSVKVLETSKDVYALTKKTYLDAHQAKEEGRPVAWVTGVSPIEILHAMDIVHLWPESYACLVAAKRLSATYCQAAENLGYSVDLCSYAKSNLGMLSSEEGLPEPPLGGLPEPDFLVATRSACDTHFKWFQNLNRHFGCPIFVLDAPYNVEGAEPENMAPERIGRYIALYKELIAFCEEQTKTKLDNEKLQHTMELSYQAGELWQEIMDLRKAVPAPFGAPDSCAILYPIVNLAGTKEAVEVYARVRDEVKAQVERGQGVLPEEKFRLMYCNIPMWYNLGLFNYVERFGAVFVAENYVNYWPSKILDPSKPLDSLARKYGTHRQNSRLERRIRQKLALARDYKVDGVIQLSNASCRPNLVGQLAIKNALWEELKVPSLILESDMGDERKFSEVQIRGRIDAFMEGLKPRWR